MERARSKRWEFALLLLLAVLAVAGYDASQASAGPDVTPGSPVRLTSAPAGAVETLLPPRPNPGNGSWVDLDPGNSPHAGGMAVLVALATALLLGYDRFAGRRPGRPSSPVGGRGAVVRGPPLFLIT